MTGTAANIRSLRLSQGQSEELLAAALGISLAAYGDLERYDDELTSAVSLSQARTLAELLGVELPTLVHQQPSSSTSSIEEVSVALRQLTAGSASALQEAEQVVGWELASFLESPQLVAADRPIVFLQDLAAHLQLHWQGLLGSANEA